MRSQKEIDLELFRINLGYYLIKSPECDLKWAATLIKHASISSEDLRRVLNELENFGDKRRYRKLLSLCREASFVCSAIKVCER
jgi:hypothetical protein